MYSLRTAFGVFAAAGLCASSALGQSYVATIISPAGYSEAFIEQAGSGQQVGFGRPGVGTNTHALIWSGTSQSFIDVNPTDYDGSFLYGVANGQQVGVGFYLGIDRAGLWNGTRRRTSISLPPTRRSRSHMARTAHDRSATRRRWLMGRCRARSHGRAQRPQR